MKKITLLLFVAVSFVASSSLFAQGRYGADSAECIKYLSFYQEYVKQGNLKDAAPLWRKAIKYCPPQASQNMLLDGMKILRKDIEVNANNPSRKKELIDSLMMLHDMRVASYPRYAPQATNNKALDMINYMSPNDKEDVFKMIGEAMDIAKQKTSIVVTVMYMNYACDLYKENKLNAEQVMNAFTKSSSTLDCICEAKPNSQADQAKKDIENIFIQSGVASCENLISLFTPRYESNKENKDVLSNMVAMLSASQCFDADIFVKSVESLHKLDPSHGSSYILYKLYSSREENDKASQYLIDAIENEQSNMQQDADYAFELATFLFKKTEKKADAVNYAKKAAELSEAYKGKAYFLIGSIWGSLKCGGNEIDVRAPYWIAVDYLVKAKNTDPSLAEDANKLINSYRSYFPLQADAFMYDVLDGATFTVSCAGMRESTIVRTQK